MNMLFLIFLSVEVNSSVPYLIPLNGECSYHQQSSRTNIPSHEKIIITREHDIKICLLSNLVFVKFCGHQKDEKVGIIL